MNSLRAQHSTKQRQRGVVFIVMMVIMVLGTASLLVSSLNSASLQIARDQVTADALAQAKEALIGYAVKMQLSNDNLCGSNCKRPGDLPCPDTDNDGIAGSTIPLITTCNLQPQRIGRLPWRTLGLPDLRDSSGERLWYAVSTNFKNSTRIGTLNSDTPGTISVFSSNGTQLNDGNGNTGAVAVIIAPGDVLQRQGGALQDRSIVGNNIASNYLDIATIGGNPEDNANFVENSSTLGFIQGRIKDNNGNPIVNDQLLVITQDNIMQTIQKRVAAEVKLCLNEYALDNQGRYPWAVSLNDLINYQDNDGQFFGRVPDHLDNTRSESGNTMNNKWGVNCNTHNNNTASTWWLNWREMVFYGLSNQFQPKSSIAPGFPLTCATAGNCLNVNNSNTPARFVVIVAGKALTNPNQTNRNADKSNAFNYLEGGNENADPNPPSNISNTFIQSAPSATFNDTLVYQ